MNFVNLDTTRTNTINEHHVSNENNFQHNGLEIKGNYYDLSNQMNGGLQRIAFGNLLNNLNLASVQQTPKVFVNDVEGSSSIKELLFDSSDKESMKEAINVIKASMAALKEKEYIESQKKALGVDNYVQDMKVTGNTVGNFGQSNSKNYVAKLSAGNGSVLNFGLLI